MQSTELAVSDGPAAGRGTAPETVGDRPGSAAGVTVAGTWAADVAALQRLGVELAAHGYQTHLVTPGDRPPHLDVVNPRARALAETVYAQGGCYWWGWAERITRDGDPAVAAAVVARVLRTVDGQP